MIGVFDSGFGGLTVMKEILKILPEHDYMYLGDQAHVPYGPRSKETIKRFCKKNIQFLFDRGAQIIIIACNSATTAALPYLQKEYPDKHILGVVIPAAEKALESSRSGVIGVVGTSATIRSLVYNKEIIKAANKLYNKEDKKYCDKIKIFSNACPLLVPLTEERWHKKPETKMIMRKYLRRLKDAHIDTLILGCTHYPILEREFKRVMGRNCRIINASREQALALKRYILEHPDIGLSKNSSRVFYTTDCKDKFIELGSIFLGQPINNAKKVEI